VLRNPPDNSRARRGATLANSVDRVRSRLFEVLSPGRQDAICLGEVVPEVGDRLHMIVGRSVPAPPDLSRQLMVPIQRAPGSWTGITLSERSVHAAHIEVVYFGMSIVTQVARARSLGHALSVQFLLMLMPD
jgi:hypothetical protein